MKKLLLPLLLVLYFQKALYAQGSFVLDSQIDIVDENEYSYHFTWIDVDNDGDLDLFISNGASGSSLFINNNGNFTRLNDGVISKSKGNKGIWGDYDNDGYLDLYILNYFYQPSELYRNKGNGTFEKIENLGAITTDKNNSRDAEWADFDNDGYLDLYVGNGDKGFSIHNWFYSNVDGKSFNRIFGSAIAQDYGSTEQVTWMDIDNDGDLDLFVGNSDYNASIYINNGHGIFSKLEYSPFQQYRWLHAVAWTDYNGDGLMDGLVIEKTACIYLSNPDLSFTKIDLPLGEEEINAFILKWGDFDNDGDQDFLAVLNNEVILFRNDGNNVFTKTPLPEFDMNGVTEIDFVDHDLDGNLDIFISRSGHGSNGASNVFLRNIGNNNNWLLVKTVGSHPRSTADNVKVYLYSNGMMQYRSRINHFAKGENNSLYFHFGLGTVDKADSILVKWPSGISQSFYNVDVNQFFEISEPLPALPGAPSDLSIVVETYRMVNLYWLDRTSMETHYVVERRKEGETAYSMVARLPRNTTFFKDFGLEAETTYHYKVYAINKAGASPAIADSVTTISAPPAPSAPVHLTETNSAYQVNLRWEQVSGNATAYIVERSDNDSENFRLIAEQQASMTTYVDTDVLPKRTYFYRVAALNDGIVSPYSDTLRVVTNFIIFKEAANLKRRVRDLAFIETNNDNRYEIFTLDWKENYHYVIYDIREDGYDSTAVHIFNYSPNYLNVAVGDMDNDNRPDYVFNPNNTITVYNSKEGSSFEQFVVNGNMENFYVIDLNNDGKNELVFYGQGLRVYDQHNGHFYSNQIYLEKQIINEVVFMDYDNDGDKDMIVFYRLNYWSSAYGSKILENIQGKFVEKDFPITHSVFKALPADYDNDGDLDLFLIGGSDDHDYAHRTYLYKNNDGQFQLIATFAEGGNAAWIDYDNDGDLDLVISNIRSKSSYNVFLTVFYENKGLDQFIDAKILDLPGTERGKILVADFDGDGDMDLVMYNDNWANPRITLYRNQHVEETGKINKKPTPPADLSAQVQFNTVAFAWGKSTDEETPQAGLTYNLMLKRKDTDDFVVSPMSNPATGFRKINKRGNMENRTSFVISCLPDGDYQWSVQAIDPNNNGSEFAPFQEFSIAGTVPAIPTLLKAQTISFNQINLSWKDNASNETGYIVERKIDDGKPFHAYLHIIDTLPANAVSYIDKALEPDKTYVYRISAHNCSGAAYAEITGTTLPDHFTADLSMLLENTEGYYASFGDYDNDGFLDVLINYNDSYGSGAKTSLFRNVNGKFQKVNIPLVNTRYFSWVDMNSDGYLDIFISQPVIKVYLNKKNGTFDAINFSTDLPPSFFLEEAYWADFDNDGDLDALVAGTVYADNLPNLFLLVNEGNGKYEFQAFPYKASIVGDEPWADFNNDGFVDLVAVEGTYPPYKLVIFKNKGNGKFEKMDTGLPGLKGGHGQRAGELAWGDYNGDGFLDLLAVGQHGNSSMDGIIKVYKNNNGQSFSPVTIDDNNYCDHISAKWGDLDNDGRLDIVVYGYSSNAPYEKAHRTRWYKNMGGDKFTEAGYPYFDEYREGMIRLADFDNDGDLDMLHLGKREFMENRVIMFRNNYADHWNLTKDRPGPPVHLNQEATGNGMIKLMWDKGSDDLSKSLSYNVILKSEKKLIVIPNSLSDGTRTIVGLGNAGTNQFMLINGLKKGTYEWAVQSIDNIYRGSAFSELRSFTVNKDGTLKPPDIPRPRIFPNPVTDYLIIDFSDRPINGTVEFISVDGRLIYKIAVTDQMKTVKLAAEKLRKGVIIVKVTGEDYTWVEKLIY